MTNHTISATIFQTPTRTGPAMLCVLCGIEILEAAAAGPYNAAGELTFMCNQHFRNSHQFIGFLADFIAEERNRTMQHKKIAFTKAIPDAWFLY